MGKISQTLQKAAVISIQAYRLLLSPWVGNRCRFSPTCSTYALAALSEYGFIKGIGLIVKRLGRCHPWAEGGVDELIPNQLENRRN